MVEDWIPLRKFCEVSQRRHDEIKFYIRYYDPKISSFKPVSITDTKWAKQPSGLERENKQKTKNPWFDPLAWAILK